MSDNLNKIFNVEPSTTTEIITKDGEVIVPHADTDEAVEYDYDKTRNNLHSLLSQGQDALMHALEVAKQSEHPRAFEVVGNLVKQLADVNHQLLDLTEKKQKLQGKKESKDAPQTVNNNAYFVGSTAELNKMLQDLKGK